MALLFSLLCLGPFVSFLGAPAKFQHCGWISLLFFAYTALFSFTGSFFKPVLRF